MCQRLSALKTFYPIPSSRTHIIAWLFLKMLLAPILHTSLVSSFLHLSLYFLWLNWVQFPKWPQWFPTSYHSWPYGVPTHWIGWPLWPVGYYRNDRGWLLRLVTKTLCLPPCSLLLCSLWAKQPPCHMNSKAIHGEVLMRSIWRFLSVTRTMWVCCLANGSSSLQLTTAPDDSLLQPPERPGTRTTQLSWF